MVSPVKLKNDRPKYISPGQLNAIGKGRGRGLGLKTFLLSATSGGNIQATDKTNDIPPLSLTTRGGAKRMSSTSNVFVGQRDPPPPLLNEDTAPQAETTVAQGGNNHAIAENVFHSSHVNLTSGDNSTQKIWKPRGRNRCQKVARLSSGNKLPVTFFNGRVAGDNSHEWSRHIGKLVRDRNIMPIRIQSWDAVEQRHKDHLWAAMTEKFSNDDMESYKNSTLRHMKDLWNNWRGDNHRTIKGLDIHEQLKLKPTTIEEQFDWEWLVKCYYHSPKFVEMSQRNTNNRLMMDNKCLHRSGSKPYRAIAYDMGGKDGKHPNYGTVYFESHKKGEEIATAEAADIHSQIIEVQAAEPSLTHVEVAERVHGVTRTRGYVPGYGGGVKPRDIRGPYKGKNKLLADLKAKDAAIKRKEEEIEKKNQENRVLKERMDKWEPVMEKILKSARFRCLMENEENIHDDIEYMLASPSTSEDTGCP